MIHWAGKKNIQEIKSKSTSREQVLGDEKVPQKKNQPKIPHQILFTDAKVSFVYFFSRLVDALELGVNAFKTHFVVTTISSAQSL